MRKWLTLRTWRWFVYIGAIYAVLHALWIYGTSEQEAAVIVKNSNKIHNSPKQIHLVQNTTKNIYEVLVIDRKESRKNAIQRNRKRIRTFFKKGQNIGFEQYPERSQKKSKISFPTPKNNIISIKGHKIESPEQEQSLTIANGRYKQVILEKDVDEKGGFTDEEMANIHQEMLGRMHLVRTVCKDYGIGSNKRHKTKERVRYPPTPNYDVLYIDRKDSLTWCPVYKAASTTWLNVFCLLAGTKASALAKSKEQISYKARKLWPFLEYDEAAQAVPRTTKFMIVRHPFERIVSAYRDKLENISSGFEHGVLHFYEKYGKKIVKKYRKHETPLGNHDNPRNGHPPSKGVEPTFAEFAQYLVDTDLVLYSDDHWMPYYLYCTPCFIDYDVIAKFETLDRDQKYLLQKLKLESKVKPEWKHLTKGLKTSEIVEKYIKKLDRDLILKLAKKYEIDFRMYNYTYDQYL